MSAVDVEHLASLKKRASALEAQLSAAGITPASEASEAGGDDRIASELDRLRKENASLKASRGAAASPVGAGGDRAVQLDKVLICALGMGLICMRLLLGHRRPAEE